MLVDRRQNEPSALISYDIWLWINRQPLPVWSSCSGVPSVSRMQQSTSLSTPRWKKGHAHYSDRGWLWTHQQISHGMISDVTSSSECLCANMRRRWRWSGVNLGIGMDVLSDIQLLLNVLGLSGQRQGVQFAWPAPPWFWMLRFNWSSSMDAHVAPG